ncbi:hypothetical protein Hanom_Chr13g01188671 [Helianthus anomalus]
MGKLNESGEVSSEFTNCDGGLGSGVPVAGIDSDKVDEEVRKEKGNPEGQHGVSSLAAHGDKEGIPMHVENPCGPTPPIRMVFSAPEKNCSPISQAGPTFREHWANLVGQVSPRPRKRHRSGTSFCLEDMVGQNSGPASSINKEDGFNHIKGDLNLNEEPRTS